MANKVLLKNGKILNQQKTLNASTVLYLPLQGENNATTTLDYSQQKHSISFANAAKISTDSSYYNGGSSLYLDGTSSYVEAPFDESLNLGESFTIKTKFMTTAASGYREIICQIALGNATGGFAIYLHTSTSKVTIAMSTTGSSWDINNAGNTAIVANRWYDMVVVKTATHVKLYLDGVMDGAWELAGAIYGADPIRVGMYTTSFEYSFTGYIQDVTIVKGEEQDDFKFYDSTLDAKSSYLKAAWKFGEYSVYDCIGTNHLTNNGTVTFTDVGMQGYKGGTFNGSDQSLTLSNTGAVKYDGSDYLISCWLKVDANNDGGIIAVGNGFYIRNRANNVVLVGFYGSDGNAKDIYSTTTLSTGVWYHVVAGVLRGSARCFINGVSEGTPLSISGAYASQGATIMIGGNSNGVTAWYDGMLDEMYIYNGISFATDSEMNAYITLLYNSGKAKLLELDRRRHSYRFNNSYLDSYSKYLVAGWNLDETAGTRYDNAGLNHLADNNTVGSADDAVMGKVATFNGSSQYLNHVACNDFNFGSSDFTISFWFKLDAADIVHTFATYYGSGGNGYNMWYCNVSNGNNKAYFYIGVDSGNYVQLVSDSAVTGGVWHMFTAVRSGSDFIFYIDALSNDTGSGSFTFSPVSAPVLAVGSNYSGSYSEYLDGNMSRMTIYKGVALDTTAITSLYNAGLGRKLLYNQTLNKPLPDYTDKFGMVKSV
jgi:hypothetical protein